MTSKAGFIEPSLREKDCASIRKILAMAADNARKRLAAASRRRGEIVALKFELQATITDGSQLLSEPWHPEDQPQREALEDLVARRVKLIATLNDEAGELDRLDDLNAASVRRLESWRPTLAPSSPDIAELRNTSSTTSESSPPNPTSETETTNTASDVVPRRTPISPATESTEPSQATPTDGIVEYSENPSSEFVRLIDRLSDAENDLDVVEIAEDALDFIDHLHFEEVPTLLSRILDRAGEQHATIESAIFGSVTSEMHHRGDSLEISTIDALRERSSRRRASRPQLLDWIERLEQESLDIETHAVHYPESLARLIIQKIAFDGKRLTVVHGSDFRSRDAQRVHCNVFGKLRATKERVSKPFLEGLAQNWNNEKSERYWAAEIARLNVAIAKQVANRGAASPRPVACAHSPESVASFEGHFESLNELLNARADQSPDTSHALRDLVVSSWNSARGNPIHEGALARLLLPHADLVTGRDLRHLRKVIAELSPPSEVVANVEPVVDGGEEKTSIHEDHPLVVEARELLRGKKAVIIGGERREVRIPTIQKAFDLESLEWVSVTNNQGLSDIARVRRKLEDGTYDLAWIVTKFAPHSVSGGLWKVRTKCNYSNTGYGLVRLAEAYIGNRDNVRSISA